MRAIIASLAQASAARRHPVDSATPPRSLSARKRAASVTPEALLDWTWRAAALLFGLLVGSFANVCIHRLPLRLSVVRPGSRCPHCESAIRAWQNVPVLSFLLLGARCARCRAPISWRYPLVEALNGALWLALAWQHGMQVRAGVLMVLATALIVLALIDLDHQILPDVITLPGIVAGLVVSGLPGWPVGWLEAGLTAAGGYLAFAAVAESWKRLRGIEALGQGDWKMAAMLGAFLGWQQLLLVVFLASFLGALVGLVLIARHGGDLRRAVPLGTFLSLAALVALFVGQPLLAWYRGLYAPYGS